ncbi:MAG: quinone-dependent dihydroorotate dehydrogenase [Bacteroidales bacterium]|nr:quinone-dependent dihydroorotate dehydrogenase [Bacteroidales bacterium]
MYKTLFRPLFFLIDAEKVHHVVVFFVKLANRIPGVGLLLRKCFTYRHPVLVTRVAGLEFPGKVGMAAGFDKNADFYNDFSVFGFSFVEIGTVTPLAQPGNPKPRLFRLPADRALINRMGFNNKGLDHAVKQLQSPQRKVLVGGNMGKNTATSNTNAADDYLKCFEALYDVVDYFVVNVSCPNIKDLDKLQDTESLGDILNTIMTARAKKELKKPVFLKISPDLSLKHLDETLELYRKTGLDGIVATNTTTSRTGLITSKDRISEIGSGGLSGNPLKERALEMVRYICKQSGNSIPVIASGGILTPADALDMIRAGASLVQVYTGFIYEGPFVVRRIDKAIAKSLLGLRK